TSNPSGTHLPRTGPAKRRCLALTCSLAVLKSAPELGPYLLVVKHDVAVRARARPRPRGGRAPRRRPRRRTPPRPAATAPRPRAPRPRSARQRAAREQRELRAVGRELGVVVGREAEREAEDVPVEPDRAL